MILRKSNVEVLKGVRRLKAIAPNVAVKNPTEKHIWKFAVSVVDTISMKLESGLEFGKLIVPYKPLDFNLVKTQLES